MVGLELVAWYDLQFHPDSFEVNVLMVDCLNVIGKSFARSNVKHQNSNQFYAHMLYDCRAKPHAGQRDRYTHTRTKK